MIDPKDLIPVTITEMKLGGIFYRKEPNGAYSTCQLTEADLKRDGERVRQATVRYAKEGMLFIRKDRPWEAFE